MILQHFILFLAWIEFSMLHSIFASSKFKKAMLPLMKEKYKYYRILYSAFAFINLVIIVIYSFTINSILLWQVPFIETIISYVITLLSSTMMIYFAAKFFFDLSGADIFFKTKKTQTLIITSFYRYVRHPLYTSTLLFVWSIVLWRPLLSNFISCISITIYTIIGIYFEEKKLVKDFGESYITYRAKTPMLIPKFY